MLKGIDPLLGPDLLATLRAMGHGDEIAIVDANYPAQAHARRLVRMDGHDAPRLVDAVLSVMPLDADVPQAAFRPCAFGDCARKESVFSEFEAAIAAREPGFSLVPIAGQSFYDRVRAAYAIVASGERRLYGNIILRKGVIRPEGDAA
ncbi:transporter [Xanthobacter autotrophicus]|uniref:RbsD/FucU family protein n=1 Tax=Xanthobacter TaxID=279 RepID=UPI0024AA5DE3|nr:RbsD/FucU domain-containing protein [Xanthobacter autotrophicus]MDI4664806.1 transporter [Xanthobacter autotrophicus]